MSAAAIPVWHCDLKGANGQPLPPVTVGMKFEMDCSGDIPVTWSGSPHVVLPEKALPYSLVILTPRKLEATAAEFVVTSYRAGAMKPEYIRVMTGEAGFEASSLEWNVQSVLQQGQQGEGQQQKPQQPYPPYGPFRLAMPFWVWIAVAFIVASVCSALWLWFRRVQSRRRLADDLAHHSPAGALTPSAQFHKELRLLSRKLLSAKSTEAIGEWNETLDRAIRVHLLRQYEYLTLNIPRSQLLRGLQRKNRQAHAEHSPGLEKIFSEMDRFQTHAVQHKPADYEQILNIARAWCDQIEKRKVKRA